MTQAAQIEDDISRLFTTPCPSCGNPYNGRFREDSLHWHTQQFQFIRESTEQDWDDWDIIPEADYIIEHHCAEWACGAQVPNDIQTLIAIYRGNITLYADPQPRLRPGESL